MRWCAGVDACSLFFTVKNTLLYNYSRILYSFIVSLCVKFCRNPDEILGTVINLVRLQKSPVKNASCRRN